MPKIEHLLIQTLSKLGIKGKFFSETGSHSVAQAGIELITLLPQPPHAGITDVYHHTQFQREILQPGKGPLLKACS
jgi:hypothetical protein